MKQNAKLNISGNELKNFRVKDGVDKSLIHMLSETNLLDS